MFGSRVIAFLGIGLAFALILSFSFWRLWSSQRKDYQRLFTATESMHQSLAILRAQNGQLIAQNQVLTLKSKELASALPGIAAEIRNLDIRIDRAQSVSTTGFTIQTPATVTLRDSVIYDTVHVRLFDYQDGFFNVKGTALGDQQHLELSYQDTLVQVVYRGARERPWLWFFSPRKLMQRVSLKNPNARIHYNQTISIEH